MNLIKVGGHILNLDNATDFTLEETADSMVVKVSLITGPHSEKATLEFTGLEGIALRAWLEAQSTDVINWHRRVSPEASSGWGSAG